MLHDDVGPFRSDRSWERNLHVVTLAAHRKAFRRRMQRRHRGASEWAGSNRNPCHGQASSPMMSLRPASGPPRCGQVPSSANTWPCVSRTTAITVAPQRTARTPPRGNIVNGADRLPTRLLVCLRRQHRLPSLVSWLLARVALPLVAGSWCPPASSCRLHASAKQL